MKSDIYHLFVIPFGYHLFFCVLWFVFGFRILILNILYSFIRWFQNATVTSLKFNTPLCALWIETIWRIDVVYFVLLSPKLVSTVPYSITFEKERKNERKKNHTCHLKANTPKKYNNHLTLGSSVLFLLFHWNQQKMKSNLTVIYFLSAQSTYNLVRDFLFSPSICIREHSTQTVNVKSKYHQVYCCFRYCTPQNTYTQ